jgi:transposase
VEINPTRMCELLVGLPDMAVVGVDDGEGGGPVRVLVESRVEGAWCRECGVRARVKDRPVVELIDLAVFGRPARLVWRKHRWRCPAVECPTGSWTHTDARIAPPRGGMTTRAGRWTTVQVGREGRTVKEVSDELGCDWHTTNDTVLAYGSALLDADTDRVGGTEALGLDEILAWRQGPRRRRWWATTVVDVPTRPGEKAQLIDLVEGRTAAAVLDWLDEQPAPWRAGIRWGVMDLSGPYRKVLTDGLPDAIQVADPFHVTKAANTMLDEVRRRVQNETLGHRGRKDDPLYRARRMLVMAHERLNEDGATRLRGLLEAGDPHGELRDAWHAKEVVREIYSHTDPTLAAPFVDQLASDLQDESLPAECHRLGRTIARWRDQIIAWHSSRVSNGPTEAVNNLVKRVKRVAFGFRRFRNFRIRALLYAGRPNWTLLHTLTPR